MRKRTFICRNCGHKFELNVVEPGEAQEKNLRLVRPTCPKCRSGAVERK